MSTVSSYLRAVRLTGKIAKPNRPELIMNLITEWRDECRAALTHRPASLTYKMISDATGIKESWIKHFAMGLMNDPSVNTINTLSNFLTNYKPQ